MERLEAATSGRSSFQLQMYIGQAGIWSRVKIFQNQKILPTPRGSDGLDATNYRILENLFGRGGVSFHSYFL